MGTENRSVPIPVSYRDNASSSSILRAELLDWWEVIWVEGPASMDSSFSSVWAWPEREDSCALQPSRVFCALPPSRMYWEALWKGVEGKETEVVVPCKRMVKWRKGSRGRGVTNSHCSWSKVMLWHRSLNHRIPSATAPPPELLHHTPPILIAPFWSQLGAGDAPASPTLFCCCYSSLSICACSQLPPRALTSSRNTQNMPLPSGADVMHQGAFCGLQILIKGFRLPSHTYPENAFCISHANARENLHGQNIVSRKWQQ